MKTKNTIISFLLASTLNLAAQTIERNCSKPSILRITMKSGDPYYQLDGSTPHKLFTLGEVSRVAASCSPDKMIFVVSDSNVPLSKFQIPEKEQITSVRYFIQYSSGQVQEIEFGKLFPKLPTDSKIQAVPKD